MKLPDRGQAPRKPADDFVAAEEAGRLSRAGCGGAWRRADGVDWYEENGTAIDEAAFALTRLRRAEAGLRGGPRYGDEAVRRVLEQASPESVLLAREPRHLLHGRDGLSGSGRALVPEPAGPARVTSQRSRRQSRSVSGRKIAPAR